MHVSDAKDIRHFLLPLPRYLSQTRLTAAAAAERTARMRTNCEYTILNIYGHFHFKSHLQFSGTLFRTSFKIWIIVFLRMNEQHVFQSNWLKNIKLWRGIAQCAPK